MSWSGSKLERHKPSRLEKSVVADDVPVQVLPGLFIGSIHCAFNDKCLQAKGITHVVNCSGLPASFPNLFSYLSIQVRDKEYANILACLPASNMFIESGFNPAQGKNVLVHCSFGRSRSAALVIAFLMHKCGMTYQEAHNLVKEKRPVVSINDSFTAQLKAYEKYNLNIFEAHHFALQVRSDLLASERRKSQRNSNNHGRQDDQSIFCPTKGHAPATMVLRYKDTAQPIILPMLASIDLELCCLHCESIICHTSDVIANNNNSNNNSSNRSSGADSDDDEEQDDDDVMSIDEEFDNESKEMILDERSEDSSICKLAAKPSKGYGNGAIAIGKSSATAISRPKLMPRSSSVSVSDRVIALDFDEPCSPLKTSSSSHSLLSLCSDYSEPSTPLSSWPYVHSCKDLVKKKAFASMQRNWIQTMGMLKGSSKFRADLKWLVDRDAQIAKNLFAQDTLALPQHGLFPSLIAQRGSQSSGELLCSNCHTVVGNFMENAKEANNSKVNLNTCMVGARQHRHEIQQQRELGRSSSP